VTAGAGRPRRILVLCRSFLGDMVLARPAFRNLRAWAPEARIVAAVYASHRETLALHPEVDETIVIPRVRREGRVAFLHRWLETLRGLRREPFDLAFDLMESDRSAVLVLASGARRRVGFAQRRTRPRHRVYTDLTLWTGADMAGTHARDLYLRLLEAAGVPIRTRSIEIDLEPREVEEARARVRALVPDRRGPLVVLHPGASSPNKCWPPERFAAIGDFVREAYGAEVLLIGGAMEAEALRVLADAMRAPAPVVEGVLRVRQLAALLGEADLFLGNDSGPMHLAAAMGTPVVALFGASSRVQWGPLGPRHAAIGPPVPCGDACAFPGLCRPPSPYRMYCIRRVEVEEVRDGLRRLLGDRPEEGASP
jgi:heptosyltransferase III